MAGYVPVSPGERAEELATLGLTSLDELYHDVPASVYTPDMGLPAGKSEMEVTRLMEKLAGKNKIFRTVLRGAGAYRHYIPAIVREVMAKEAFRTTYTPYQAEISQGILQSIFEYQTDICELTGMDASNASVYDGATAAAEAVFMCLEKKRNKVLVSAAAHPQVREVMKTYCDSRSVELVEIPAPSGVTDLSALIAALDDTVAAVYVQSPNFYGLVEDGDAIVAAAHAKKAKVILGVHPIALGLMKTPGEYGADIAVGDGQPLGMPLAFGGPYMGFMACTAKLMRKLPGRIVGETTDAAGRRAYVLTLQAREQHIRREKASSNICSNEALCAMTAGAYLAAMGPQGLARAAQLSCDKAHYFAEKLKAAGYTPVYDGPFFHEFLTTSPLPPTEVEAKLAEAGILSGLPLGDKILWCVTELVTKDELDEVISILEGGA